MAAMAIVVENSGGMMNAIPALVGLIINRLIQRAAREFGFVSALVSAARSTVRTHAVNNAAAAMSALASAGRPPPPGPVSTSATARHATAAGAGNCSPPIGYVAANSAYVGTAPKIPIGIPASCARSCFLGDSRIIIPARKSCMRSPACPAPPHATAAAIKFVTIAPGATSANTSWMILPIGPIGLISVSPVHRTATYDITAATGSARIGCQRAIPKLRWSTEAVHTPVTASPTIHHDRGIPSGWSSLKTADESADAPGGDSSSGGGSSRTLPSSIPAQPTSVGLDFGRTSGDLSSPGSSSSPPPPPFAASPPSAGAPAGLTAEPSPAVSSPAVSSSSVFLDAATRASSSASHAAASAMASLTRMSGFMICRRCASAMAATAVDLPAKGAPATARRTRTPARSGSVGGISGGGRVSMERSNTADASAVLGKSSSSSGSGTGTMGLPSASSSGSGSGSGSGGSTGLPSSSSSGSGSGSGSTKNSSFSGSHSPAPVR
mmetsp:Transcript_11363/g.51438  ORF Transcript_11363/g.51438 Transcript_11363/m.51438 type:complete len:495 (+) Transcript_11363:98-1582(+)